jgi:hypothetical protein
LEVIRAFGPLKIWKLYTGQKTWLRRKNTVFECGVVLETPDLVPEREKKFEASRKN